MARFREISCWEANEVRVRHGCGMGSKGDVGEA